ncbi:MAG: hypothetical protein KUG78_11225 [Kangiellaceae bacterium]|nr:hypothetical protein [Kangiellaceae bacterium]
MHKTKSKRQAQYMIENVDTEMGNNIISSHRENSWSLVSQYFWLAFDKGIDYDYYRLRKGEQELYFEWDNWFEWKIVASLQLIRKLNADYTLNKEIREHA